MYTTHPKCSKDTIISCNLAHKELYALRCTDKNIIKQSNESARLVSQFGLFLFIVHYVLRITMQRRKHTRDMTTGGDFLDTSAMNAGKPRLLQHPSIVAIPVEPTQHFQRRANVSSLVIVLSPAAGMASEYCAQRFIQWFANAGINNGFFIPGSLIL